jgi:hypothetical protein
MRRLQRWRAFQGLFDADVAEIEDEGSGETSGPAKWFAIRRSASIWSGVSVHESRKACNSMGSKAANRSRTMQKSEKAVVMVVWDVMFCSLQHLN